MDYFLIASIIVIILSLTFISTILYKIADLDVDTVVSRLDQIIIHTAPKPPGPVPPKPGGRVKLKVKNPDEVDNGHDDWIP